VTSYARYPKVPIKPVTLIAQYDDLVDRIFDDVRAVIFPHQAPPGAREVGPGGEIRLSPIELTNGEMEVGALRSVGYGIAIHLRARAARRYDGLEIASFPSKNGRTRFSLRFEP
jgi:hypothetical protein